MEKEKGGGEGQGERRSKEEEGGAFGVLFWLVVFACVLYGLYVGVRSCEGKVGMRVGGLILKNRIRTKEQGCAFRVCTPSLRLWPQGSRRG